MTMRVSRPQLKTKQNKNARRESAERQALEMETEEGVIRQASPDCAGARPPSPPVPVPRNPIPTSHHPTGEKRQARVKHVFEEGEALI